MKTDKSNILKITQFVKSVFLACQFALSIATATGPLYPWRRGSLLITHNALDLRRCITAFKGFFMCVCVRRGVPGTAPEKIRCSCRDWQSGEAVLIS